jgi:hypothetical protein
MEVCFTECIDGLKLPNEYKYSAKGKSYNGLGGLFHLTIRPGSVSIYKNQKNKTIKNKNQTNTKQTNQNNNEKVTYIHKYIT